MTRMTYEVAPLLLCNSSWPHGVNQRPIRDRRGILYLVHKPDYIPKDRSKPVCLLRGSISQPVSTGAQYTTGSQIGTILQSSLYLNNIIII